LPVKTAPIENGPSPKRPHFRLKRPQAKKQSVKTAPYEDFIVMGPFWTGAVFNWGRFDWQP